MIAKLVIRHSIVKYKGRLFMIETNSKPILLFPKYGEISISISGKTEVEVIKYPAQLAIDFLNN